MQMPSCERPFLIAHSTIVKNFAVCLYRPVCCLWYRVIPVHISNPCDVNLRTVLDSLKEHFTGLRISDSALGAKHFWSHIKLGSLALSQSKLDSGALC